MLVRPSCRLLATFLTGVYRGRWDPLFHEIDSQGIRLVDGDVIMSYPKMGLADFMSAYTLENAQAQNVARFAERSALSQLPRESEPAEEHEDVVETGRSDIEKAAAAKEETLKTARLAHAKAALGSLVSFVVRPGTIVAYKNLFEQSEMITRRAEFCRGSTDNWRHAWLYDAGSDVEPQVAPTSKRSHFAVSPQTDSLVIKQFFGGVKHVEHEANDVYLMPSSRSKLVDREFTKASGAHGVRDDLFINYVECQRRGVRNSCEVVYAASSKGWMPGVDRGLARLKHLGTSLQSNCVVGVEDWAGRAQLETVTKGLKLAILGEAFLAEKEKELEKDDLVVLFHWEKSKDTWAEIFHHYGLTSLATISAGSMPLLQAAIEQNIKVFCMCRNDAHLELLQSRLIEWVEEVSATVETSPFFVSRASLIHQYGLEPDAIVLPRQPCKENDDAVWSLGEEEADGDSDAIDEEDGKEGEEDDDDDLEDVPAVTPVKKGVKRRQSGQKVKAKAKARKTKGGSQKSNPKE